MKRNLFIIIAMMAFVSIGNAQVQMQQRNFDITLAYPLPVGNNFIHNNYGGVADVGIAYAFFPKSLFSFGVRANAAYMVWAEKKMNLLMSRPGLFLRCNIKRFGPWVGFGYAFYSYYAGGQFHYSDMSNDGINASAGLNVKISELFYAWVGYDYYNLRAEGRADISYNRNIHVLNLGVGVRFGFDRDDDSH